MSVLFMLLGIVAVGVGGAAGALGRWGLSRLAEARGLQGSADASIPWGTFTANMLACFLIGLLTTWLGAATGPWQKVLFLLLSTGLVGALSTVSGAALEIVNLSRRGAFVTALGYLLLTLGGGNVCLWLAVVLAS